MLIGQFNSIEKVSSGYKIVSENADILIIFMNEDIFRIRVSFSRNLDIEQSYSLVKTAWEDRNDKLFENERETINPLDLEFEESVDSIYWSTGNISLKMNKNPIFFTVYDGYDKIIYEDLRERAFEKDHLGRIFHYNKIDIDNDHFYGFGEKTGYLDKKNNRLRMATKDAIGQDPEYGDPMYKHIPFYIRSNSKTYDSIGLFYDNSYDGVFDMGKEISGYWDRYSYYSADGGDINLYFIYGPRVKDVVEKYTYLTGTTAMPTKQSLGYCASTMYYAELSENCDEEIYKVIEKHKKEDINIDNFWLASGYSQGSDGYRHTFNWNKKKFPNPKLFLKTMDDKGINVMCNLKPGVLKGNPYNEFYTKNDAFIKDSSGKNDYVGRWWGGKGKFIDFTSKKARSAWKSLLIDNILKMGTKSVWNDNCEMDGIEDREAVCDNEGYLGTMENLKPIHANMMAYVAKDAISDVYPSERPHIISRAGYSGIQRYAQVWGGDNLTDWRTIKFNINTILGMGLSGCANMGCDIGGFAGPAPSSEMLLRWIQQGIFQPRFTINSANNDNSVTQPFMYKETLEEVKKAYKLRYELFPYLYSLMYESSVNGSPVMRPIFYEFPEDTKAYSDNDFTFMFGRNLLVANVVEEGANFREIYFPKGCDWYDINDNLKKYEGGSNIKYPVTLDSIPMFLRSDGILIKSRDIENLKNDIIKQLDILISDDKENSFVFYDDDGHSLNYKKGDYINSTISVKPGIITKINFNTKGDYKSSIESVSIKLVSKSVGAYWVKVNGKNIKQYIVEDEYEASHEGWFYDLSDRTICLKFRGDIRNKEIEVSRGKFDLIGMNED